MDGCDRPHESRGWCRLHYERWQRRGDPLATPKALSLDELLTEIEWLRGGGVSPELICDSLKVSPETLVRRLDRSGLRELASLFRVSRAS